MDKLEIALITWSGVAITALVTWSIAQRRIAAQHVIAERARWREEIRVKAAEAHDAILRRDAATVNRLKIEFSALLNPFDRRDRELLAGIKVEGSHEDGQEHACKFAQMISLLLKHDWDRAKLETSVFLYRWFLEVRRWDCDWRNEDSVQASGTLRRRFYRWIRRRRSQHGLSGLEKYKLRLVRILVSAAILVVASFCTRLDCFVTSLVTD